VSLTKITDHANRAYARLAQHLKESPSHKSFAAIIGKQVQDLEEAVFSLLVMRQVDTATAGQLDEIGNTVGVIRPVGGTDAAFRLRIKARILGNRSTGVVWVLLRILQMLAPPFTNGILINDWEYGFGNNPYEADITIRQKNGKSLATQADADEMAAAFKHARPAGVGLSFHYALTAVNFEFDGGNSIDGFGDVGNAATGNDLIGALRG
jgi:hypothetical protein